MNPLDGLMRAGQTRALNPTFVSMGNTGGVLYPQGEESLMQEGQTGLTSNDLSGYTNQFNKNLQQALRGLASSR